MKTKSEPQQESASLHAYIEQLENEKQQLRQRLAQTENALDNTTLRLQTITELSERGIWEVDLNKDAHYFSNSWKAMPGYNGDELPDDKSTWNIVTPESHKKDCQNIMEQYLSGQGESKPFIASLQHKDGQILPIRFKTEYLYTDGAPSHLIATCEDISNLYEAQQKASFSLSYADMIARQVPACIAYLSNDNKVQYINEQFLNCNCVTKTKADIHCLDDMLGKPLEASLHPQIGSLLKNLSETVRKTKTTQKCEEWYDQGCQKSRAFICISAIPHLDEENQHIGTLIYIEDLTDIKNSEQKALENSTYLRMVIDTIPSFVSFLDAKGNYVFINKHHEVYFNQPETSIIGKPISALLGEDIAQTLEPHLTKSLKGEYQVIERWWHMMGQDWYIKLHMIPKFNHDGSVNGVLCYTQDLTQHKSYEEELEKRGSELANSETRFHLAIDGANDGVWDWDLATGYVFYSKRWKEMLGYTTDELGNDYLTWEQLLHPDDRENAIKKVKDHVDGKTEQLHFEKRLRHKNGSYRYIMCRAKAQRDMNGNVLRLCGTHTDVTDIYSTRKNLEQTIQELIKTNAELKNFAYIASHDLREPLRGIATLSQMMSEKFERTLPPSAQDYLLRINKNANHMRLLVEDLLEYAICTTERPFIPVDMNRIMDHVLCNLHGLIDNDVTIHHTPLPTVTGDERQLTQVLQNLISNAIKYRRKETATDIHVGVAKADNETWLFSVKDNGIGISPEYYDVIFNIFKRLHHRDQFSGSGIGLAICKKAVENHRGKIWVEANQGENGCTFYFSIPKTIPETAIPGKA